MSNLELEKICAQFISDINGLMADEKGYFSNNCDSTPERAGRDMAITRGKDNLGEIIQLKYGNNFVKHRM